MARFARCPELILAAPTGELVEVVEARRPLARLLGLALLEAPPREALLLPRCRSVHTAGMRFPIDVVFVAAVTEEELRVAGVRAGAGPWRVIAHPGEPEVGALELAAGRAARLGLWPGRALTVVARRPR